MSSYREIDLFGSGPHRTRVLRRGIETIRLGDLSTGSPGTAPIGDLELIVVIQGRLVASDEPGLWALREAIAAETEVSKGAGVLVDTRGRSFEDLWFVRYEESGAVDRGRAWTMGYEASFRRLSV